MAFARHFKYPFAGVHEQECSETAINVWDVLEVGSGRNKLCRALIQNSRGCNAIKSIRDNGKQLNDRVLVQYVDEPKR